MSENRNFLNKYEGYTENNNKHQLMLPVKSKKKGSIA